MKLGLDIETDGKEWYSNLISVQFFRNGKGKLYDVRDDLERAAALKILNNPEREFVPFSSLFDCYYLRKDLGISFVPAGDAFILANMAQEKETSLNALSIKFLKRSKKSLMEVTNGTMSFDQKITDEMKDYAIEDAELSLLLEDKMSRKHKKFNRMYRLELALVPVLVDMRLQGLKFDAEAFAKDMDELENTGGNLYEKLALEAETDFRPGSNAEIADILFNKDGHFKLTPVITTKKDKASVSKEALGYFLDIEWVRDFIELKHINSVLSTVKTYTEVLAVGRAHPEFRPLNQSGSSRIYTTKPAINQLPVEARHSIVADEGYKFIYADWSGAELILLAYAANQRDIIEVYEKGGDVHRYVTSNVLGKPEEEIDDILREISKIVTFSIVYGSEGGAASRALRIPFEEGRKYVNKFLEIFSDIAAYRDFLVKKANKTTCCYTPMGRRRVLYKIKSRIKSVKAEGERQAMNTPIQNGVADLQKWAMIRLYKTLPEGCRLVFSVFDSFLIQIPEEYKSEDMEKILSSAFKFKVNDKIKISMNYSVKVGHSWGKLQE